MYLLLRFFMQRHGVADIPPDSTSRAIPQFCDCCSMQYIGELPVLIPYACRFFVLWDRPYRLPYLCPMLSTGWASWFPRIRPSLGGMFLCLDTTLQHAVWIEKRIFLLAGAGDSFRAILAIRCNLFSKAYRTRYVIFSSMHYILNFLWDTPL